MSLKINKQRSYVPLCAALIVLLFLTYTAHAAEVTPLPTTAPGDTVPIDISLINTGAVTRTDVSITYEIIDSNGAAFSSETEKLPVEAAADFSHDLILSQNMPSGNYRVIVSLAYPGQKEPASYTYSLKVETRIDGIFVSALMGYFVIGMLAVMAAWAAVTYIHRKHHGMPRPRQ